MPFLVKTCAFSVAALLGIGMAAAQQSPTAQAPVSAPAPGGTAEGAEPAGSVALLFETGQSSLSPENQAVLDKAARIYREGQPIIMIVTGGTDTVGSPEKNLLLSEARANSVARGLLERGIPAERCQILAKGETNPTVQTPRGVAEAQNRRVEISWR